MAVVDVVDTSRNKVAQIDVSDTVFNAPVREHLFHDVVRMQLASRRSGTAATKTRSEVSGGGKKSAQTANGFFTSIMCEKASD